MSKWREFVVFFCMLVAFIVFTTCPTSEEKLEAMEDGVMKNLCSQRSNLLMIVGSIITAMVFIKMLTSKGRKHLKEKFKVK
jgi:Ca2+/Na+ antiporter